MTPINDCCLLFCFKFGAIVFIDCLCGHEVWRMRKQRGKDINLVS